MDLARLLGRLNAIGGMQGSVTEEKKPDDDKDGVPNWADKNEGEDDTAPKSKANEDIFNVLKGLQAIREGNLEEDDVEEGNEFAQKVQQLKSQGAKAGTKFKTSDGKEHVLEGKCSECGHDPCDCDDHDHDDEKLDECGDMDMSPLTAMADANGMPAGVIDVQQPTSPAVNVATDYDDATDSYPGQENGPAEEKARYTLSIQNGDSSLNMTTDMPDEIIHIMKLAGVQGKAEVKKAAPEEGEDEKEVDEAAWGNTPAATNEKEPKAYGDIRDWGQKGTGQGKEGYGDRKAPGHGDNPMSESAMFAEYKKFKAGK